MAGKITGNGWMVFLLILLHGTDGVSPVFGQNSAGETDKTSRGDTLNYQMDEIVVTGSRYPRKIIDIPYPVNRVESREFFYQRPVAVNDVLGGIPGLFMQSRYGNHDVRISIRGFGSRSNSGIRGVRILLDDIPESEPDGQTRIEAVDFDALGKIEVVNGNSSSLYTNAPGGVINFMNDIFYQKSHILQYNNFGSFGLRKNGIKFGIRSPHYTYMMSYSHYRSDGYREHSDDDWDIVNTVLETVPTTRTSLQVLGYYVNGQIRLPGSLTREQYEQDPWQAAPREVSYDFRRLTRKGRLGVRFTGYLDNQRKNQVEITGYVALKYFERTTREYRIMNRYVLGASVRFINKRRVLGRENEFNIGGDLFRQAGPVEYYQNVNGQKSDILTGLTEEMIGNRGFYFQNTLNLYPERLYLLLSGRYDRVIFDQKNQILAVQNDQRIFVAFTPKLAVNYKLTPAVAVYSSIGRSFDTPAGNELDNYPISSDPGKLLNPDLQPQKSKTFEIGLKGDILSEKRSFIGRMSFTTALFRYIIEDEVVPLEVFGDSFYRNAAETRRDGVEIGLETTLLHNLELKGSYTFSDFTYDQYTARTIELDNQGYLVIRDQDFSGNYVPSIPRHNLYLSLAFSPRLTRRLSLFGEINFWMVSRMTVDDGNSEWTDDYRVVNLIAGGEISAGMLSLYLSGGIMNLLEQEYVAFININSASGSFYEAGAPRNYYAALKIGINP